MRKLAVMREEEKILRIPTDTVKPRQKAQVRSHLDFLKTYNQSFTAGYQFRKSHLIEQISLDIELKEKAGHLYKKYGVGSYLEIVNKLLQEMQSMGFAECISEQDETYKITSAFHYAEELVNMIQIANEDEIPE